MKTVYTFKELLTEYMVEIPIIQRDYAQGRTSENETSIRNELLNSIYFALTNKKHLDFDFVYGSVNDKKFLPLDGQQRLTTFFLLHWYLAQKEGVIAQARAYLCKFSYTTRISSRDFCNMLVQLDFNPQKDIPVSEFLKDANGYYMSWDNDPTIGSMLVMLDAIHELFFECEPLYNDLPLLTFNLFRMENFSLTDDLYIKMNARGKALSVFENFKAKFIQHLRETNLPFEQFEKNIDGKWLDLLWDYRSDDNTIDAQFMNLFRFFSDMIFLLSEQQHDCESPFRKNDIRTLVDFYNSVEKTELLYQLLDLWSGKAEIDKIQNELFSVDREATKVRLFDRTNTDLFGSIICGSTVTLQHRVLLFAVMMRYIKLGKDTSINDMRDFCRIVRNLLIKSRFFRTRDYSYQPDFRFGRNAIPYTQYFVDSLAETIDVYGNFKEVRRDGINSESIQQEVYKAKIIAETPESKFIIQSLEDSDLFKSSIFNVVDLAVEMNDTGLADKLEELFTRENSTVIVRALLSYGDYGIYVKNTAFGKKKYYGNIEHWYETLSNNRGEKYKTILVDFIKDYLSQPDNTSVSNRIGKTIERNIDNIDKSDWRYCIVKYPSTVSRTSEIYTNDIVFTFENNASATIVHRMNGKTLNAIHVLPEYIEAAMQLQNLCYSSVSGKNSDDKGAVRLTCVDNYKADEFYDGNPIELELDYDGEPCISCYDDEDEHLIDAALNGYGKQTEDLELDRVEKIVLLGKIIDKMFTEKYSVKK